MKAITGGRINLTFRFILDQYADDDGGGGGGGGGRRRERERYDYSPLIKLVADRKSRCSRDKPAGLFAPELGMTQVQPGHAIDL